MNCFKLHVHRKLRDNHITQAMRWRDAETASFLDGLIFN